MKDSLATADGRDSGADGAAAGGSSQERVERLLRTAVIVLVALLVLASFYTLYIAKAVLLPITAAVLLSLLLSPIVRAFARMKVPPPISAGLIIVALIGAIAMSGYQLAGPTAEYVKKLPDTARRLAEETREVKETVDEMQRAAQEAGKLADGSDEQPENPTVKVQGPTFGQFVLDATRQTLIAALIVFTLLYFLLAGKDMFLEKLVRGLPTVSVKKRAVNVVRKVENQVGSFLLAYLINNALLGVAVTLALWWLGMPNPLFFGVVAALFNFVPYAGAVASLIVIGLASAGAFDNFSDFIGPPLAFLILTTLEGTLLQPVIVGRRLALNPVAVFVALIFWAWLWGIPGALLAIPILATLKAIFEEVPTLQPIAAFFGR